MKDIKCKLMGELNSQQCLDCFLIISQDKSAIDMIWKGQRYISRVECKGENCTYESDSYVKMSDQDVYVKTELDQLLEAMMEANPASVFMVDGEMFICCEEMKQYYDKEREWRKFNNDLKREGWEFFEAEDEKSYYKRYRKK